MDPRWLVVGRRAGRCSGSEGLPDRPGASDLPRGSDADRRTCCPPPEERTPTAAAPAGAPPATTGRALRPARSIGRPADQPPVWAPVRVPVWGGTRVFTAPPEPRLARGQTTSQVDTFESPGPSHAIRDPFSRLPRAANGWGWGAPGPTPPIFRAVSLSFPHRDALQSAPWKPRPCYPTRFVEASSDEDAEDVARVFDRLGPCGGAVWLPPGRSYRIATPPLVVPANTLLLGGGESSRLYTDHPSYGGPLIRIGPDRAGGSGFVTIRRLLVDGTEAPDTAGRSPDRDGVHIPGVSGPVRLSDVTIRGCRGAGVRLAGTSTREISRPGRVVLDGCSIERCGRGLRLSGGASAAITDCRITDAALAGLEVVSSAGQGAWSTEVTRTTIARCGGAAVDLDRAVGFFMRDCLVAGNGAAPAARFPPRPASAQVLVRNSAGVAILESSVLVASPPRAAPVGIGIFDSQGVGVLWNVIEPHLRHNVLIAGASNFITVIGVGRPDGHDGLQVDSTNANVRRSVSRRDSLT